MDFSEPKDTKEAKKKVRGKPFQKGLSSNPKGKRPGTRNAATLAAEALLEGESEAVTRKAIAMALGGDMAAMRLAMERILPPRRERPLQFDLPPLKTAADAMTALARIAKGVAQGALSDSEARTLVGLVHTFLETLAQAANDLRMAALETFVPEFEAKIAEVKSLYVGKANA